MSLPSLRRISRADLPGSPDWIESLLYPLNLFMDSVGGILSGGFTAQDNLRGSIREFRVTTSATYTAGDFTALTFPTGLPAKAIGVQLLQISRVDNGAILGSPVPIWTERNGEIVVKYIAGLADETRYTVRLLVF